MTGAILNTATVLIGGTAGWLLGHRLPPRRQQLLLRLLGLVTLALGGKMVFDATTTFRPLDWVVLLVSLGLGIALGVVLGIQSRLERAAERLLARFAASDGSSRFAEGWLNASLLFCVGPMTILGSLQDGLTGDYRLIAIKSALDGVAALGFAATFGAGVLLSAASVLVVQGAITLGAGLLSGWFTPPVLSQCGAAGGVLVLCIGMTLTGLRKLPVADYLPVLLFAALLAWLTKGL